MAPGLDADGDPAHEQVLLVGLAESYLRSRGSRRLRRPRRSPLRADDDAISRLWPHRPLSTRKGVARDEKIAELGGSKTLLPAQRSVR